MDGIKDRYAYFIEALAYCEYGKEPVIIVSKTEGEIAYENSNNKGLGTFHKELFNAISNFNKDILIKKANFQEIK